MLAEVYIMVTDMGNKTVACRGTWEAEGAERQSFNALGVRDHRIAGFAELAIYC